MEEKGNKVLDDALLNAYVKCENNDSLGIVKQNQLDTETEWIDTLIDCRLIFISKLSERYEKTRSKDDFVALKESISRLAEFMIIRERCF